MRVARRKRRGRRAGLLLLPLLLLGLLLLDSNARLVTEEYVLHYKSLPPAFDGFRIVQLSDIHAAGFGAENEGLVSAVLKAEPDLIVVTGDLIDRDDQLDIVRPLMARIAALAPVYYVTGNHEWDSGGIGPLFDMLADCGVTTLRNRHEVISRGADRIVIAGLDDPNGPADMKMPEEVVAAARKGEGDAFIVLLGHRNNMLQRVAAMKIPLFFCGHAHGGIVRLPFTDGLIGPNREWLPSYTSGVYSLGETRMVVSRGIGNHTGYPRLFNNPHIAVAILKAG